MVDWFAGRALTGMLCSRTDLAGDLVEEAYEVGVANGGRP